MPPKPEKSPGGKPEKKKKSILQDLKNFQMASNDLDYSSPFPEIRVQIKKSNIRSVFERPNGTNVVGSIKIRLSRQFRH